jgi:hypothetical protein
MTRVELAKKRLYAFLLEQGRIEIDEIPDKYKNEQPTPQSVK